MVEIGDKINGRYQVIGNVGSGGMANVFLAHDLILDRDVAVKVLRFDFLDDKSAIRRFQREALAASELVHPNIVGVYDVGEENGRQYLVMEYVKGTDLKKYIQKNYPIPLDRVIIIMRQILSAISLAHQHRIIHRDLKPQNILMDEDGNVKIADFGIAIALSETSLTQTNTLLGSVHYLSPEQARGSMATRQSDIYALGIILYELLVGTVPFEGESAVSIALKHFQSEIPSVREVNPAIPQALENVILKATTKEASDRYVSAEEMADDIATSLSPSRANEPRFEPTSGIEETKVLTPITDADMPDAFRDMPQNTTGVGQPKEEAVSEDKKDVELIKKKKKHAKWWVISFLALTLAIVGFLLFAPRSEKIPDISGKTEAEAREILKDKGFKVKDAVEEEYSDTLAKGLVLKTSPRVDSRVKKGEEITLIISKGTSMVEIDDYEGKPVEEAKEALLALGFEEKNIKIVEQEDSEVEAGYVISQTPSGGSKVSVVDRTITLTVSKGSSVLILRDLSGYTVSEAISYLKKNKLTYSEGFEYSNDVSKNQVIRTEPNGGYELEAGSNVLLIISLGPEPVTEPPSSTPPEPTTPSSSSSSSSSSDSSSSSSSSSSPTTDSGTEESTPPDEEGS